MNILFLCESDPRETSYGGAQRSHRLHKALQTLGDVYTLCLPDVLDDQDPQIRRLEITMPKGWRYWVEKPILSVWNFFDPKAHPKALPYPYSIENFPYAGVKFDAIVCRYTNLPSQLNLWKYGRLFVDIDDHPITRFVFERQPQLKPWQRPVALWLQQWRVNLLMRKVSGCWVCNPADKALLKTKAHVGYLPNIPTFPQADYDARASRQGYLMTVGVMAYEPNYQGVETFLKEVWPKLHELYPDVKYHIIGKGAPNALARKWNATPGVEYLGFVDNLQEQYAHCIATVVPIDQGGGTCIKTLESLAHSRVCLSTACGARGLMNATDPDANGLFVYHSAASFVSIFKQHVADASNRLKAERQAAHFVEQGYTEAEFEKAVKQMLLPLPYKTQD